MSRLANSQAVNAVTDWAWKVILNARKLVRRGETPTGPAVFAPHADGSLRRVTARSAPGALAWDPEAGWQLCPGPATAARDLLDLYRPLYGLPRGRSLAVGHLGQSLDGCIATRSGDSCYVTGQENILHLHRMRALCDCIIVGAETVAADDPRLTTRLVVGGSPVRVVLDPRRRLHRGYGVFRDGASPTLLVCDQAYADARDPRHGQAEVLGVRLRDGHLDLAHLLQRLRERGLRTAFVEGGGVTVSAFLQAGLLDRLQIAVAPVVIGNGRPGLQLPPSASMGECLRPRHRIFRMGEDILFDCEPMPKAAREEATAAPAPPGVERLV